MRTLLVLCALPAVLALPFIGSEQAVAVKGRLTCNGKPAENVKVKLYEKEITLDKLLNEKFSDSKGAFELGGHKKELSTIDPKVNIYHRCNYNGGVTGKCYKKISVKIPKNFVAQGLKAEKVFDIGELNLAGGFSGQSTDCFN